MEINNNCVPQLRFPGFVGEWEMFTMEDLFDIRNGYTPSKYNPEFWEGGTIPWFRMEDIRQNGHILSDSIQHVTPAAVKGAGLFPAYSIIVATTATIGEHALIIADSLANQQFTFLTKRKSHDNKLDMLYFHQYMFIIDEWCKKNTNAGGLLSVNMQAFKKLSIPLPSLEEQNEIVECLEAEDRMIAAQEQKVESLKTHKKGLMQQLFPQPGATTPALRFPGFTGDWQFVNGDKLFEPISNKKHNSDLPILALTQDQGAVPREMINYNVVVSDKSVTGYKVVEVDDFIISLRSFQGGIEYSRYKGLCSPAYIVLRKKDKTLSSDFYRIYFKSFNYIQNLNKNLEGIRDGKMISYQQFSEIMLPLPTANEQIMIANCISSLDEVILLESQKLESLKTHKKGLMQQLFPQPVK